MYVQVRPCLKLSGNGIHLTAIHLEADTKLKHTIDVL